MLARAPQLPVLRSHDAQLARRDQHDDRPRRRQHRHFVEHSEYSAPRDSYPLRPLSARIHPTRSRSRSKSGSRSRLPPSPARPAKPASDRTLSAQVLDRTVSAAVQEETPTPARSASPSSLPSPTSAALLPFALRPPTKRPLSLPGGATSARRSFPCGGRSSALPRRARRKRSALRVRKFKRSGLRRCSGWRSGGRRGTERTRRRSGVRVRERRRRWRL